MILYKSTLSYSTVFTLNPNLYMCSLLTGGDRGIDVYGLTRENN